MNRCSLVPGLTIALFTAVATGAADYLITDIGALDDLTDTAPTPPTSAAFAINDAGVAAGSSAVSGGSLQIDEHTWIAEPWTVHAVTSSAGVITDLGVLGGDVPPNDFPRPSSWVNSINVFGHAVGDADLLSDGWYHPFLHLPEPAYGLPAGFTELPILAVQAHAWAINGNGIVAGESRETPASSTAVAVYWTFEDGEISVTSLGTMGGVGSIAYGVNGHDEITGAYQTGLPDNTTHAFLHLPEAAYGLPAGSNVISAGFPGSIGHDVNDLGQVAGRGPGWSPMIWLPESAYGLPAGLTYFPLATMFDQQYVEDHGFLGAELAEFYAINDTGVAVGDVQFAIELPNGVIAHTTRGFVWRDGVFTLLQDLQNAGWPIISLAHGVNEAGQIAGAGVGPTGDSLGFVMTPRAPGDVDGDGVVGFTDLLAVLSTWGPCPAPPDGCPADLDGSGGVDFDDLLIVLSNWGG